MHPKVKTLLFLLNRLDKSFPCIPVEKWLDKFQKFIDRQKIKWESKFKD